MYNLDFYYVNEMVKYDTKQVRFKKEHEFQKGDKVTVLYTEDFNKLVELVPGLSEVDALSEENQKLTIELDDKNIEITKLKEQLQYYDRDKQELDRLKDKITHAYELHVLDKERLLTNMELVTKNIGVALEKRMKHQYKKTGLLDKLLNRIDGIDDIDDIIGECTKVLDDDKKQVAYEKTKLINAGDKDGD